MDDGKRKKKIDLFLNYEEVFNCMI